GEWTVVPPAMGSKGALLDRLVKVDENALNIEARVTDEAGNVGSTSAALLRGRADPAVPAGSGCGCSMPGGNDDSTSTNASLAFGALAVVGAVFERRRRRLSRARRILEGAAASSLLVVSAGTSGCTCAGGDGEGAEVDTGVVDERPALVTYVIGSYTSAVRTTDGKIWVAGYHEGDPSTGASDDFKGDLVVGQWDETTSAVKWVVVDGVPKVEPTANQNGFRGGITDPGDDVGQYTSIVLDSKQNPIVAYYDKTNGALRGASYDGTKWTTFAIATVDKGWTGRWTSMTTVGGKAVVAFQSYEASTNGFGKVRVRVARATTDSPTQQTDWTVEDVVVDDKAPCIQEVCSSGQKCLVGDVAAKINPVCTATTTGCDAACTDVCVKGADGKPTCTKAKATLAGYTNAIGSYISLAATASGDLGLAFYDRSKGNLRGATGKGGKWVTTPATAPIDGWVGDVAKDKGNGDRGVGATLAIDATGNWHLAYVDGITESLLYKFIPGGDFTKGAPAIIIDDGNSADGSATKFTDGLHLVGEDAHLFLEGSTVKIAYQDSTAGTLRWAKGPGGATAKFTRGVIKQDGFGGFYPTIVGDKVANFFRMKGLTQGDEKAGTTGDPVILGNVRVVTLP
ncbi:MAG: MYXO-CTERM sorting domain-containing protein, partial [Polyangiales bacterium]